MMSFHSVRLDHLISLGVNYGGRSLINLYLWHYSDSRCQVMDLIPALLITTSPLTRNLHDTWQVPGFHFSKPVFKGHSDERTPSLLSTLCFIYWLHIFNESLLCICIYRICTIFTKVYLHDTAHFCSAVTIITWIAPSDHGTFSQNGTPC